MTTAARKKRKINERAQQNALSVGLDRDFSVMQDSSNPTPSKSVKKARAVPALGNFATPAKSRHVRSGKENDTPSIMSSASRSAKAQALTKLQDLAPDIALYEKEKKRTAKDGHGVWGGKRALDQIDKERVHQSSSPKGAPEEDLEDEVENKRPAKRAKVGLPDIDMRVCLTGYTRWVKSSVTEEADRVCLSQDSNVLYSAANQVSTEKTTRPWNPAGTRERAMRLPCCSQDGPHDEVPPMPSQGPGCDRLILHHSLHRDRQTTTP